MGGGRLARWSSDAIRLVLTNLAVLLFVAAVVLAAILRRPAGFSIRLLNLLFLLSVGIEDGWAGFFHVFFHEPTGGRHYGVTGKPFSI